MIIYDNATESDLDQLVTMRMEYLEEDFGDISIREESQIKSRLPGYFMKHLGKDCKAYVARDGEQIIATVLMVIEERPANPHYLTGTTGVLLNVYTKEYYRHQGHADKLVRMAIAEAKEKGLSNITLTATRDGYGLYKKIGFVEKKTQYTNMIFHL